MAQQIGSSAHWYCHVEFDVVDPAGLVRYLEEQVEIERENGMKSYEFFIDNPQQPTKAILLECFPDDAVQLSHLKNFRPELFLTYLANPRITVLGNPPDSVRDRMLSHGFWPPAFEGEFCHWPYLAGFR